MHRPYAAVRQNPIRDRASENNPNDSSTTALGKQCSDHDGKERQDDGSRVTPALARGHHHCEHRQHVPKIGKAIQKSVPSAFLPSSPWCRPPASADILNHFYQVELARNRKTTERDRERYEAEGEIRIGFE